MACLETPLYPARIPDPLPLLRDNPAGTLLQASPALVVALSWIWIESRGRRRGTTVRMHRLSQVVGSAAILAQTLIAWRIFDLFYCEEAEWADRAKPWQYVAVVGGAIANGLLLFVLGPRLPRTSLALALVVAAGAVVADWSLRGGVVTSGAPVQLARATRPGASDVRPVRRRPAQGGGIVLAVVLVFLCARRTRPHRGRARQGAGRCASGGVRRGQGCGRSIVVVVLVVRPPHI